MSGILDKKTRVLDSIITLEGRKQLSEGGIGIRYVTFTDNATFYAADIDSGSADATLRLYLESCHLPQDEITFQSDEAGRLMSFKAVSDKAIRNGQLLSTEFKPPTLTEYEYLSGSDKSMFVTTAASGSFFQKESESLLASSIDNFKKLQIIGTKDSFFDDSEFAMGNKDVEFVMTPGRPIPEKFGYVTNINQLENVNADPRFSNLINFKYLPPINKAEDVTDKTAVGNLREHLLGSYSAWNSMPTRGLTQNEVLEEHTFYTNIGFSKKINFDPTSYANNLFFQAFEVSNDTMFKLDIVDFGVWQSAPQDYRARRHAQLLQRGNRSEYPTSTTTHIFFVGKLLTKPETMTHSFVHLFTLIFG